MAPITLPVLPANHSAFIDYLSDHPDVPLTELVEPYRKYEAKLRELYAQDRDSQLAHDPHLNTIPIFTDRTNKIKVRARNLAAETQQVKDRYIMALPAEQRRADGSLAVVSTLNEFRRNLHVFCEASLADFDWSNVVLAGSAAVNCLLPVPEPYRASRQALREYYHEKLCPASDVDLYLHGLTAEQAVEKIKLVETRIRDAAMSEVTAIRTKHTITFCSQYPVRHVQVVLRLYKNISEIITGFDVDCSGIAYDGQQVYCTPRAIQSYMSQINHIDLTRRSPSYENRLSKYSHRGFEVYWSGLDRSRIDPTIFKRSFQQTSGLARLLLLEQLPMSSARDDFMTRRRQERGRPDLVMRTRADHKLRGNVKDDHKDEVADWDDEDVVSIYHSFNLPYGARFNAKKIERLCFKRDLLLNAERTAANHRDRPAYLHRHPVFFGRVQDVIKDCCGSCPAPLTEDEKELHREEAKRFVSGALTFIENDPGRQLIGSFNPLTEDDWTEMGYVGNTSDLFQAIINEQLDLVDGWLKQEGADPNTRDYSGKTPLHLAVLSSTQAIVELLVKHGARLTARLVDGRTALHLAAERGDVGIVKVLMDQSIGNEAMNEEKLEQQHKAKLTESANIMAQSSESELGRAESDEASHSSADSIDSFATGGFVKVSSSADNSRANVLEDGEGTPDYYDVNGLAWDAPITSLHSAIISGHADVVRLLCQEYGADVLLPIKIVNRERAPVAAILNLVLTLLLPQDLAAAMIRTLLDLGASCAQADLFGTTAFFRFVEAPQVALLDLLWDLDRSSCQRAVNYFKLPSGHNNEPRRRRIAWPLITALEQSNPKLLERVLDYGAEIQLTPQSRHTPFTHYVDQPLMVSVLSNDPGFALELLARGADPNPQLITRAWYTYLPSAHAVHTALDVVDARLCSLRLREAYPARRRMAFEQARLDDWINKYDEGTWQREMATIHLLTYNKTFSVPGESQPELKVFDDAIAVLEEVYAELVRKGGRFCDEYSRARQRSYGSAKKLAYKGYSPNFWPMGSYNTYYPPQAPNIDLFEAAWSGDIQTIKRLVSEGWIQDNEKKPLHVAVATRDTNPFALAVKRGHYDAAAAILEIAASQHGPEVSDIGEDGPAIYAHVIDETSTTEDIGQEACPVPSKTSALQLMEAGTGGDFVVQGEVVRGESRSPLNAAVHANDRKLVNLLCDLMVKYDNGSLDQKPDGEPILTASFDEAWTLAIELDRVEIVSDLICRFGAGMPIAEMIKISGIDLEQKPQFYQGLTIYGKKRKDWARSERASNQQDTQETTAPLLRAALIGSFDLVKLFVGDTAAKAYMKFCQSSSGRRDGRLEHLRVAAGGWEQAISKWLGADNDFVIHCAVLGPNVPATERLIEYLIKTCPASLEARTCHGQTPLQIAAWYGRVEFAKVLIQGGANQAVKSMAGENLVHHLVTNSPKAHMLGAFLDLVDQDLLGEMWIERTDPEVCDGQTPLHRWASTSIKAASQKSLREGLCEEDELRLVAVLKILLLRSRGRGLSLLDASGDSVMHTLVKTSAHQEFLRMILEVDASLLYRENAAGRTPAELAYDGVISELLGNCDIKSSIFVRGFAFAREEVETRFWPLDRNGRILSQGPHDHARSSRQHLLDFMRERLATHRGKRRLLTLQEANDVAKRVGGKDQAQKRYGWTIDGREKENDADTDDWSEDSRRHRSRSGWYNDDFVTDKLVLSLEGRKAWDDRGDGRGRGSEN